MTSQWTPGRLGDLTGKRIIVTGATNGVGLATATALARAGARVILAVRNTELGAQRAAEMTGDTVVAELDLADLSSVRAFPGRLDELGVGDVDILINNAGTLTRERTDTSDGFEATLATNLLGPFALTNLLFDRVREQIINVGSEAHKSATLHLDDLHLRTHKWTVMGAYAASKLTVMLWGLELDRRLRAAGSPRGVKLVAGAMANDKDAGAATTLYCISEPIPPGSYVGVDGRLGLRGGPVLIGRSVLACDYAVAGRIVQFAEQETGTELLATHAGAS
jgi:NAD(P)-dependent dehydrogenase (short-subunit alcohol dehydrogenase family)